jgi:hypothetical protein
MSPEVSADRPSHRAGLSKPATILAAVLLSAGMAATAIPAVAAAPTALRALRAANPDALPPTISRTDCGHGAWSFSAIPAKRFNPLTATAAQLNANDYPIRPAMTDAHEYAQWRKFAVSYRPARSSCASLRDAAHITRRLAKRHGPMPTAASTLTNWSGYVAHDDTYTDAEAEWDLPSVTGVAGTDDFSASWVGIGLGNSSSFPLFQAGSESDYLDLQTLTKQYYLWYEIFPEHSNSTVVDTSVHPGDLVGAHVTVDNSSAGCDASTCVFLHVWDATTGFNNDYVFGGDWSNDGHAEWIYERPCILNGPNCEVQYLADAAPQFTEAQAVIAGTQFFPLGDLTDVTIDMTNCGGTQVIAKPGAISSSGYNFTEQYLHHGDANECSS